MIARQILELAEKNDIIYLGVNCNNLLVITRKHTIEIKYQFALTINCSFYKGLFI